ncbi:MAG: hypothetical protein A3F54_01255 [Candidatus Kerfeldbacteria bacterium RIFCSPHIGHO2_12_FULL_48_17]|uniref:DUF3048 domain-containing protein n=1 Tax=Candidatus Kerfeldbacteria bacterium RIFCSPHIGHO2_12_FULL_48_17 TaxID=1798542 RepID=A0A1G2AXK6_9BACT|nr:MAG: hypothetical protein A3F54_01255 [Candidatus Kerfeldbacteria bacterium RIFCSPHIGHO2_12_FULL_48_17]
MPKENKEKKNTEIKIKETPFWKKYRIAIIFATLAIIIAGTGITYAYMNQSTPPATAKKETKNTQAEKTTPSNERHLDGRRVAIKDANKYPVAVMIENLSPVRPQAGLGQAQVVYESLVEGGITRFMAIYDLSEKIDEIGPVRSARPYYLEWVSEYDALYAHAGGSPEALQAISGFNIHDLNQIGGAQGYYWRSDSVPAPHNLFTSTELLTRAINDNKLADVEPTYTPWTFTDDPEDNKKSTDKEVQATAASNISIDFSSPSYKVEYAYDATTKEYLRSNGGVPHTDKNTEQQIRAKTVVVVSIPPVTDVGEKGRITLSIHGGGPVRIARFGEVITGTWKKADRTARTEFFDARGEKIDLGRGNIWVEIVPEDKGVEFK